MRFKLDENFPVELVHDLRTAGHDAQTVPEEGLTGAADSVLTERARVERRALLTMDKGIAALRIYPPKPYAGCPPRSLFDLRPRNNQTTKA